MHLLTVEQAAERLVREADLDHAAIDPRQALGGRLDLVADFGDRTVRLPVSDTATAA